MGDTQEGLSSTILTLATSSLTSEQIQMLMGTDAFEPYLVRSPSLTDSSQWMSGQEDLICYLRVPLFTQGESVLQMAFCSRVSDAFTEEDGELFFRITRPLAQAMSEDFNSLQPPPLVQSGAKERCDLLLMCRGLTDLCHEVKKIAPTECMILVYGPTGAGKEVLVDALHAFSRRSTGPLIKVNCGAIAESLLESELFGYEKGAFTGALQSRAGFFEAANGGTLFLDEVGELPPRVQVGLLRVLDNHEVTRVGSTQSIPLNVRILAATHRDLRQLVAEGKFREDLWYRLNAYTLHMPSLKEHRVDIPVLANYFVNKMSNDISLAQPPYISASQIEALCAYDWPGNIRELRHVAERAVLCARQGNMCAPLDFVAAIGNLKALRPALYHKSTYLPQTNLPLLPTEGPYPTLGEWTDEYIHWMLEKTGGKITGPHGAATLLAVHPNTLRAKRDRSLHAKEGSPHCHRDPSSKARTD
ncbi:MAG: sigma-54 dependent transcriptional regulator [Desulfovibrionaceae bacterium]